MTDEAATKFQSYLFFVGHYCQLIRAGRAQPGEAERLVLAISADQAQRIAHLQQRQLGVDDGMEFRSDARVLENVLCRYLGRPVLYGLYQEFIALTRGLLH